MLELIAVLAPILGVWAALGVGAKALGITPTVKDGMKKIAQGVAEECGITSDQQENASYAVDEQQLQGLTNRLKPFFSYLVFNSGFSTNDFLKVTYECSSPNVSLRVIEQEFRNFLRNQFNLPANSPLFTWVYLLDGQLVLICAFTDKAREWVQVQRNNQRSRELPNNADMME